MKRLGIILGGVAALFVAWYLISPIWRTVELNEASPLAQAPGQAEVPPDEQPAVVKTMEQMDDATKAQFEKAMEEAAPIVMKMDEPAPQNLERPRSEPALVFQAPFTASAHEVEGRALLIKNNDTNQNNTTYTVRFENFKTINGPNLHIYLAADLEGKDYIDLGSIRATEGNVNYEVPAGTDIFKYNKVMVWCVPFRVLFSYAEFAA